MFAFQDIYTSWISGRYWHFFTISIRCMLCICKQEAIKQLISLKNFSFFIFFSWILFFTEIHYEFENLLLPCALLTRYKIAVVNYYVLAMKKKEKKWFSSQRYHKMVFISCFFIVFTSYIGSLRFFINSASKNIRNGCW